MNKLIIFALIIALAAANGTIETKIKLPDSDYIENIQETIFDIATQCGFWDDAKCAVNVARALVSCTAAAAQGGANIIADLGCISGIISQIKGAKGCIDCICQIANKNGWKIIGCN